MRAWTRETKRLSPMRNMAVRERRKSAVDLQLCWKAWIQVSLKERARVRKRIFSPLSSIVEAYS